MAIYYPPPPATFKVGQPLEGVKLVPIPPVVDEPPYEPRRSAIRSAVIEAWFPEVEPTTASVRFPWPTPPAGIDNPPFGSHRQRNTAYEAIWWWIPPHPPPLIQPKVIVPIPPPVNDPPFDGRRVANIYRVLEAWTPPSPLPTLPRPVRQPGPTTILSPYLPPEGVLTRDLNVS